MAIHLDLQAENSVLPSENAAQTPGQRAATTIARHKQEARTERLLDIQARTDDGSLVVRQMTTEQHVVALELADLTRRRNAGRRRYRSPGTNDNDAA